MSFAKVAVICGLTALLVSACGIQAKPLAGSNLGSSRSYYGVVDDPRVTHVACLKAAGMAVHEYRTSQGRLPAIQVGTLPAGPTIVFYPTPGIAQGLQILDQEQGAEVIGSALLYPNRASDATLSIVERCAAVGVSG